MFPAAIIWVTCAVERLYACSFSLSIFTSISRSLPPMSRTCPTPSTLEMIGLMVCSTRSYNSVSPISANVVRRKTGISLELNLLIIGLSTPSGKSFRI